MTTKEDVRNLLNKINSAMENFKDKPFLAPYINNNTPIEVRIADLSLSLRPNKFSSEQTGTFEWWYTEDLKLARSIRIATQAEIMGYLTLFPRARMLVMEPQENGFWAVYSRPSDIEYPAYLPVFVRSSEELLGGLFDEVICRFDGQSLFFERISYEDAQYAQLAACLRRHLSLETHPKQMICKHTTTAHLSLYKHLWHSIQESKVKSEREVISDAVAHAGGVLDTYERTGNMYIVRYTIDGANHTSRVQNDLQAISTQGVCLAGEDSFFDLQSIVSLAARWDKGER